MDNFPVRVTAPLDREIDDEDDDLDGGASAAARRERTRGGPSPGRDGDPRAVGGGDGADEADAGVASLIELAKRLKDELSGPQRRRVEDAIAVLSVPASGPPAEAASPPKRAADARELWQLRGKIVGLREEMERMRRLEANARRRFVRRREEALEALVAELLRNKVAGLDRSGLERLGRLLAPGDGSGGKGAG